MEQKQEKINNITVFGSSAVQEGTAEYVQAYHLGKVLAEAGYTIVNGGYGGTMEAVSRGAAEAGGHTIGVTCKAFTGRTINRWIMEEIAVGRYLDRLLKLIELGDAYIALPGGTGTLAEVALVWEMIRKGELQPEPVFLYSEFWKPLYDMMHSQEAKGRTGILVKSTDTIIRHLSNLQTA
jgi:uncharacterized protein (TIGR00730 family)